VQAGQNKGSLGSRSHWFMMRSFPVFFCFSPPTPADTDFFRSHWGHFSLSWSYILFILKPTAFSLEQMQKKLGLA
jgi:hypothetical protein